MSDRQEAAVRITRTVQVHRDGELVSSEVTDMPRNEAHTTVLHERAIAALEANAEFLALSPPTQGQVLAQVRALTRQNNALIRLLLGQLDSIDNT
ncbi:MAG: hypothetical protein RIB67_07435 [Miltoncostaeaceae bacterium]